MRESKAELTDRLRREGRWEAFKRRREELKAQGIPAKQAWYQAATEFPSSVTQPSVGEALPAIDLQALKGKPPISIVQAAAWAFEQLDCDWITPADAPSPGAWSLLEWARSSLAARTEFYRMFAARIVLPPQQEEAKRAEEERQKRRKENSKMDDLFDRLLGDRGKGQSDNSVKPEQPPAG